MKDDHYPSILLLSQTVHRFLMLRVMGASKRAVGATFRNHACLSVRATRMAVKGLFHHQVEGHKLTLKLCLNTIVMSVP